MGPAEGHKTCGVGGRSGWHWIIPIFPSILLMGGVLPSVCWCGWRRRWRWKKTLCHRKVFRFPSSVWGRKGIDLKRKLWADGMLMMVMWGFVYNIEFGGGPEKVLRSELDLCREANRRKKAKENEENCEQILICISEIFNTNKAYGVVAVARSRRGRCKEGIGKANKWHCNEGNAKHGFEVVRSGKWKLYRRRRHFSETIIY